MANGLTPEHEALLIALQARHGGELARLQVARRDGPAGAESWHPLAPVTQWNLVKR